MFLFTLSPSTLHLSETLEVLMFASRVHAIVSSHAGTMSTSETASAHLTLAEMAAATMAAVKQLQHQSAERGNPACSPIPTTFHPSTAGASLTKKAIGPKRR